MIRVRLADLTFVCLFVSGLLGDVVLGDVALSGLVPGIIYSYVTLHYIAK